MRKELIYFHLLIFSAMSLFAQKSGDGKMNGTYLGQKAPGLTPEIFAPGIVSTENRVYANITFNPGFTEACWTPNTADTNIYHGGIIISKFENGIWTRPEEIRFLSKEYSHRSPFYGLDGGRLYFQANLRKNHDWDQKEKFYFVEKNPQGWSDPVLVDTVFNKYAPHWQFSLDKDKNLYFGGDLRGKENSGGIYFSKYDNGKYKEPVLIFSNNKYEEAVFGPAISPGGEYILFARIHPRSSEYPRMFSIYISFRKSENEWTAPKDLGEVLNMDANQPRISPDNKYIFFVGNDGMSYWVSAAIIEQWRPED